ncbi:tetratricopeptide repeat protein [Candidatus Oscillochloris fontis]|uniref:tetratricopeptide repeat protein n=1 Tax=Candidatus Oscillochloris fontis TaxID=2496868 RepID=UPI00101BE551|nr:tetratricopeptide repeat protein [Candidatus Oscillochloris fontis]
MATISLQAAYDQARAFLEVNKVEQAIAVAQHILEYFPESLEAHRILGEAYLASRQFDQAEAAFSRVLNADPENIPAHVGLGITYERQNKLDLAVTEFEQALEVRPDMPELRSQLLRLYTEVWGSEGATLRLSRPGLARLYAKGNMLPQAIQEFRSVIDEYPHRFDARVGLAEALWRDGQPDVADEVCEEILALRPVVLKANLLLGYIRQASGDASGERYWRFAQQLEPYQQVARALFDVLPDIAAPNLEVPAWDEQMWQEQREEQERQAQAQVQVAALVVPSALPATAEPDFLSGWGEDFDLSPAPASAPAPASSTDDDDFLSSLLAMYPPSDDSDGGDIDTSSEITPFDFDDLSSTSAQPAAPVAEAPVMEPFSLADLGLSPEEIAQMNAPAPEPAAEEPVMEPFSLADLGLSPEEIAQMNAAHAADVASDHLDDLNLQPFSLDDIDLSTDEVDLLSSVSKAMQPKRELLTQRPEPPAQVPAEAPVTPFDWDAGDESSTMESGFDGGMGDLQPFSLDDLDLNSVDDYGMVGASSLPPSLQPFSLDDPQGSLLSRDLPMPTFDADDSGQTGGYSWQQPTSKPRTGFGRPQEEEEPEGGSIFAKLRQRASELPKEELLPLPPISLDDDDEAAAYFANDHDDISFRDIEEASEAAGERFTAGFRLPKEDGTQASARPEPQAEPEMTPFSLEDLGLSPDEIAQLQASEAPAATAEEPEMTPFSLEDLGLSPDEIAQLQASQAGESVTPVEQPEFDLDAFSFDEFAALEDDQPRPKQKPPSLADLGLSPADIAMLSMAAAEEARGESEADAELDSEPEAPPQPEPEPMLMPFSLEDLGLSPEEIAALKAADAASEADMAVTGDTVIPGWSQGEEPELKPFSLAELGLSPEEIASLEQTSEGAEDELELTEVDSFDFDLEAPVSPRTSPAEEVSSDVEPFSFDEFDMDGISAPMSDGAFIDDVSADVEPFSLDDLGLDAGSPLDLSTRELGLTDDELAGLDLGELETFIGSDGADTTFDMADSEPESEVMTGDPALDKLIILGQRQGYVDLTDIIGVVDDPEAEAERIEEIGWTLHRAGIQIRDGDEIIDMDLESAEAEDSYDELAEFAEPEVEAPVADFDAEPDLTPFSLTELGLSPEEIAELGLVEEVPSAAEPPAPVMEPEVEPEMTPFSLAELGLSPEEIASLGLADAETVPEPPAPVKSEPPAAPVMEPEAEPEMTPFSLEDLGLSPEEIAALGLADAEVEIAPEPKPEPILEPEVEPEMKPFSLEELGLSPEEIAALGLADAEVEIAPEPEPEPILEPEVEPEMKPFSLEELGLSPEEIALLALNEAAAEVVPEAPAPVVPPPAPVVPQPEPETFSFEDFGFSLDEADQFGMAPQEPAPMPSVPPVPAPGTATPIMATEITPFSLANLGLSQEDIALLTGVIEDSSSGFGTADSGTTGTTGDDQEWTSFSLADLGLSPEDIALLSADPAPRPVPPPAPQPTPTVASMQPVDMDALQEWGFTPEDIAMLFGTDEEAATTSPSTTAGATVPLSLDDLGLTPEEIEFLYGETEHPQRTPAPAPVPAPAPIPTTANVVAANMDVSSLEEWGFTAEDIALLFGTGDAPTAPAALVERAPLSLEELGFSEAEIAELYGDTTPMSAKAPPVAPVLPPAAPVAPPAPAVEQPATYMAPPHVWQPKPVAPARGTGALPPTVAKEDLDLLLSLDKLGLTTQELALLTGMTVDDVSALFSAAMVTEAEPEMSPLSLEDLGLTLEELDHLNEEETPPMMTAVPAIESRVAPAPVVEPAPAPVVEPAPAPVVEPAAAPTQVSLNELGLSPSEIAMLSAVEEETEEVESEGGDLFDFDFDMEAPPLQKAVRTAPRVEEPTPSIAPEDIGFVPEPLEQLDDIWDRPASEMDTSNAPARIVLPAMSERAPARPVVHREPRADRPPREPRTPREGRASRDELYARREALLHAREERAARRERDQLNARRTFDTFVPTGDQSLDDILLKIELAPDNAAMALSVARLSAQTDRNELMMYSYNYLVRVSAHLEEVAADIQKLLGSVKDAEMIAQLYRILGDTFSKQGRPQDAIAAYNHTFGG